MSKINKLTIENFMRIRAVEITPDGNIVTISGKNGQGKSSVLDAIAAVFGGPDKKTIPMPIREGETSAHIIAETDDYVITRRYTGSTSKVEIATHDGAKFPKAQAKLDSLLGKLTFDPLEFTRMDDKKQLETLLALVDLPFDPEQLAADRKQLFEDRQQVGRDEKAIGAVEVDESLPTEEQSAGELVGRIQRAHETASERDRVQKHIERVIVRRDELEQQIAELSRELATTFDQERASLEVLSQMPATEDTKLLQEQLTTVEETNAQIRANNAARAKKRQQEELQQQYKAYTAQIEALDKTKADGLAQADMPVAGLGFDDHGVTYNGIPFKQVNPGADIIISASIGMALNPDVRVMRIKEGSLLDADSMQELARLADKHDHQIWLEVVSEGDGPGIVIEDGSVKA